MSEITKIVQFYDLEKFRNDLEQLILNHINIDIETIKNQQKFYLGYIINELIADILRMKC